MTNRLIYPLSDGFLHHWLAAGPLAAPIPDFSAPDLSGISQVDLARGFLLPLPPSDLEAQVPPVDLGPLGPLTEQHPRLVWGYYRCREDHLVHFPALAPIPALSRAWAYAGIAAPRAQEVALELASTGPVEVWLNGQPLYRQETGAGPGLRRVQIPAALQEGDNTLLVRLGVAGLSPVSLALGVRLAGIDVEARIFLPTEIEDAYLERRMLLEEAAGQATLDRYVFGWLEGDRYDKNEPVTLRFSGEVPVLKPPVADQAASDPPLELTHRLQSLNGDIFQEGTKRIMGNEHFELAKTFPLYSGPHHLALLPRAHLVYQKKLAFERKDLFYMVRSRYTATPYGTFQERAKEALKDACRRHSQSLFREVARMALGRVEEVNRQAMAQALERIRQIPASRLDELLAVLVILLRFGKKKLSPLTDLRSEMEACLSGYPYGDGTPGPVGAACTGESQAFLCHTCELLAGQLLPEKTFAASGQKGRQHRLLGEARVLAWMQRRGLYGFREWDSPSGMEAALAALAALVDLAKSKPVRDLAAALMDKLFFSLAVNSLKGMYGSSRGSSTMAGVLSARLEATAGIEMLMWGLGGFNDHLMGVVSLACCRNYALPEVVGKIALETPPALWSRERHSFPLTPGPSPTGGEGREIRPWEVNKVVYKTADFLLSSAQDYRPGEPGEGEHIWQATLGPDAVVFTTHPSSLSEDEAARPNLWVGNGVLPRVAQWGDVLVALYRLPEEDWLGFTHAYFPASVFDEVFFESGWAFARCGQAYLALWAQRGLDLITSGPTAQRELRSYGTQNAWLCHMGQALLDGSFENFRQKILAMPVTVDGLTLQLESLRGDTIAFGWEGPLRVKGQEQPLSGFKHMENPYCTADLPAEQMEIVYGEEGIRLRFGEGV